MTSACHAIPAFAPTPDLARAAFLIACRERLGPDAVLEAGEALAAWHQLTFPWVSKPIAVLSPVSGEDAAACVALAGQHGCALHPVSRGRSWGLGSRSPVRDAVMLDLSRMNRILDLDLLAGTVRVEPGVTFTQLHEELARQGAAFHVPAFGGPPDASVLANALDRGEGAGVHGDRHANLWDLDVALTTGERFRTGYGRFEVADLERHHARPAGPLLEGLLSQSSFGCVLSGRLGLAPNCAHAAYLTVEIGPPDRLEAVVAAVRTLINDRVIDPHEAFFWDGAKRVASATIRAQADEDALTEEAWQAWALTVTLVANRRMLYDCKKAIVIETLLPLVTSLAIEEEAEIYPTQSGLRGYSDGANLTSCYWAKPALPDGALNPDRDRCGFLWICPALPLDGEALARMAQIIRTVAAEHAVFVMSGAEVATLRSLIGYVSLAWDRDESGADERAMAAHDALMRRFAQAGFHSYRLALPSIAASAVPQAAWSAVIGRLRAALDPAGVFGGGRVAGLDVG